MQFSKTKILIIEDHPVYLDGLKNLILRNLKNSEVECAMNGHTAIEKACKNNFDVIFVDLQLPDINGVDVIRTLKSNNIPSKIIVNSFDCSPSQTINLMDIGVDGILQKCDDEKDIITAIGETKQNRKYYSKAVQDDLVNYHQKKKNSTFTDREMEIIRHLNLGITTAQIADRLCIAESTVNHHKKSIFNKIGVKNSIELLNYCNRNKLI